MPALRRQRRADGCELDASLVYRVRLHRPLEAGRENDKLHTSNTRTCEVESEGSVQTSFGYMAKSEYSLGYTRNQTEGRGKRGRGEGRGRIYSNLKSKK